MTTTLVLLPGMDGTGRLFAPLLEALGEHVPVSVLRYPPDQALGYDQLEQIVRQALPVDVPFVLLGESFSGPIAISLASQRPPGLVGLVLCCTFARTPRPALRCMRWLLRGSLVKPLALLAAAPLLLGRYSKAPLRAQLAQALAPVHGKVLAQRARAVLDVDVGSQLAAVSVPVHYLQAARDQLVPAKCVEAILRGNPHAVNHVIDGPHCLLQAAPVACAQALHSILASVTCAPVEVGASIRR